MAREDGALCLQNRQSPILATPLSSGDRDVVAYQGNLVAQERPGEELPLRPQPVELLPAFVSESLVDIDALGPAVVVAVDRRPPLLVSADGGLTWSERGGGLPRGRTVALGETPDDILYAARNRLYLSTDGGVCWRAVGSRAPRERGDRLRREAARSRHGS